MKDLPSFKPVVKLEKRGSKDKFRKTPFIEDGVLFIDYLFDNDHKLNRVQEEAWQAGELDSPPVWWYLTTKVGPNKNKESLQDYFGSVSIPEEIEDLYTSFWQLRLALQHPSTSKKVRDAEYVWEWYKFETTGF